jgi:iron complex outermembrane receptor protein
VGTEFRHQGGDGRIEWNRQLGPSRWVIGGQWGTQTLRVTGEEAFLPVNRGEQSALYALVDRTLVKSLRVEAGGRIERVSMQSEAGPIRVDAIDRQFSLRNFSTGAVWSASPTTTLTAHLSHSERAPNAQELLADGVHTATATYEVGDPSLKPEQSNGWNLGLRQSVGPLRLRLDIFEQRFNRFISLRSTGETYHPIDGESTAIAAFGSGAAQSRGAEIDLTWTAWERGAKRLNLEGGYDQVRLTDQTGAPLPRIPAQRWRWAAAWRDGNLSARLEALSARRVSRVAIEETPTPGWTRIDAWLGWTLAPNWQVQLTGRNLTNAVIRDHTSFLKDSSIAGGRSVLLSLRFQQ